MIGLTKRCLRKVIGRAKFTHDELVTAVTEIESILNSRPISYIMSSGDLEEPLTPSHLIVGRRLLNLPDNICYSSTTDEFTVNTSPFLLNKRMRYLHSTIDHFWTRWRDEYLLNLREGHYDNKGKSRSRTIKVGDIVVIHSDDCARGFWRLGKVKEVIPGRDGEVRGGVVQVLSGGKRVSLMRRPVQRLIPLEVNGCEEDNSNDGDTGGETCTESETPSQPPSITIDSIPNGDSAQPPRRERHSRRAAAIIARDGIMASLCED